jgi:RNA polymerase sigma factor (sigma-70 family)
MLVERCRAGDEAAWAQIVDRFSSYVYAIAMRFGVSSERAGDVHQEVFLRMFTQLGALRDPGALRPWIAQITRRAAVDALRAGSRELPAGEAELAFDRERGLDELDEAMAVNFALDELPSPFGDALRRFFVEDESYRTIGEALGIPPGTVASRISRGLSLLRELLESAPNG